MTISYRILTISHGENCESLLFKIKKGSTLQFRLGNELLGYNVKLMTNHPKSANDKFERKTFHELSWNNENYDDTSFVNLEIVASGSFQYKYLRDGLQSGSGYFVVDPNFTIKGQPLNLNSINMVTFLPKLLGHFGQWRERLEVAYQTGYNFIHFAPVQERGASDSSYSIMNQLALDPMFGKISTFQDLENIVNNMENEWGVLSICDVVLNHTANETPWLLTNPECGYNLSNSSFMRPAYILDTLLERIGIDIGKGLFTERGLPPQLNSEAQLRILEALIKEKIEEMNFHEFWQIDIKRCINEFKKPETNNYKASEILTRELNLIQTNYERFGSTIDFELANSIYFSNNNEETGIENLNSNLTQLNEKAKKVVDEHIRIAIGNLLAGIRYERVQSDGPRYPKVCEEFPLTHKYFVNLKSSDVSGDREVEEQKSFQHADYILAHNGWVMFDDSLSNFAGSGSNVYFRRELIAWGDSVKLRYGANETDCPYLWNLMKNYIQQVAKVFHGMRLDNCHSTPIHVAEYLIDAAREVRPDLYLIAELFTDSDTTDNIFVNRLGITSLIREALKAHDAHEEGRLVFRYGGEPVGAFQTGETKVLLPSIAHAIFLDQTHDNPSSIEKRSLYDMIPNSSLVAVSSCAIGSNRGYDEIIPHHIHVVKESRLYRSWSDKESNSSSLVGINSGMIKIKKCLNNLHNYLSINGFSQIFVDQMEPEIIAVTRHDPKSHESIILITYTAFTNPKINFSRKDHEVKELFVEGIVNEVVFEASIQLNSDSRFETPKNFTEDPKFLNGLDCHSYFKEHFKHQESKFVKIESFEKGFKLKFIDFLPGCVICLRVSPDQVTAKSFSSLEKQLLKINVENALNELTLVDLNFVLFRCKEEEGAVYSIPNNGEMKYCGLQGVMSLLSSIRTTNDMGHPLCSNLRDGDWLMNYISSRLVENERTKTLGLFFEKCFDCVKCIPRYLIPSYFDLVFTRVYQCCLSRVFTLMNFAGESQSEFRKMLALTSVICIGMIESSPMPIPSCPSLSAGLPHFSSGYMRNWGRDTFISLPGLCLTTGRFDEAKAIILSYARVLRHGLIPNLLDKGTHARYNCRDATWFWLHSITKYVSSCKGGEQIFNEKVKRMWPDDSGDLEMNSPNEQTLEDVIQESIQKHFEGIKFRERNAGNQIDAHMKNEGFDIEVGVDFKTGFIYGGNRFNCGTWMDKMGSSEKSGNKGIPATPRDGSAIEIVGLSASVFKFLGKMFEEKKYRYNFVETINSEGSKIKWTFFEWHNLIKENFEKYFWIDKSVDPSPELIHRNFIYKDTVGSTLKYSDYQLRPNFPIAIAVAPQLFNKDKCQKALETYEKILLSNPGVKTLDPADWNYFGFYDNSDDSSNPKVAHGFNYHNGPEWLWPVGFYLQAQLKMMDENTKEKTLKHVRKVLYQFYNVLLSSEWKGLPELTNQDGIPCPGSCTVQAWSAATLLEVLEMLQN